MFISALNYPCDLEVDGDQNERSISIQIAEDVETSRVVYVECTLSAGTVWGDDGWEFAFSISVFALDDSCEPFSTQSREIAFNYIPLEIRPQIMEVSADRDDAAVISKTEVQDASGFSERQLNNALGVSSMPGLRTSTEDCGGSPKLPEERGLDVCMSA